MENDLFAFFSFKRALQYFANILKKIYRLILIHSKYKEELIVAGQR